MRISKRLKTIAANIEAEKLLDIGCDHAYLPIYLIKEGRVKKAIACDISKGAVDRANENIKKHGYDEFISTIVSDGLDTVDLDNVDCISICGMGAITAVNILNKDKDKLQNINKLIISPQSDIQFCIDEIQKLGYKVVLEDFVEDHNKFYPIFVFEKGDAAEPFIFGSLLSENKDYKKYILLKQQKLKEIRQRIEAEQSTKVNMNKDIENVKTANVEAKDDLSNSYKNITLKEIIEKLEELSPKKYALNWDNVGLLVGSEEKRVSKVLVAVEITDELINLAIHDDIDLIITHHPLIFNSLKRIVYEDFIGRKIINLVKHNIALYCMHTNFDICGSMASIAASKLWLGDVKTLIQTSEDGKGIGVIGNLAHINFKSLAFVVKDTFNVEQLKIYGDYNKLVSRIAIIPGSAGREEIQKTIVEGAEVLISGDISHHNGIDAVDQGLFIIDAGHYGMEKIFNEFIVNYLKDNIEGLEVFQEENKEKFKWL